MRRKTLIIGVIMLIFSVSCAGSERGVDILGMQVPLPGEYVLESLEYDNNIHAHVARYLVKKPLTEAVHFYTSFLAENGFSVLGGEQADGSFDASVKKDNVQFLLRVYIYKNMTMVQFVW